MKDSGQFLMSINEEPSTQHSIYDRECAGGHGWQGVSATIAP
jgi:uncharacterized protein YbdZ (MbtH family)